MWASVYGAILDFNDFPITSQIGIFNNEDDIWAWIDKNENSQVLAIDYFTFIRYAPLIQTEDIGEYLMRYRLLKEHNLYSYGQLVDDLPAIWVDVINLIDSEIAKAQKAKK